MTHKVMQAVLAAEVQDRRSADRLRQIEGRPMDHAARSNLRILAHVEAQLAVAEAHSADEHLSEFAAQVWSAAR